jgi:hypothetical protein
LEFSAAALVGVDGAPARYQGADQTGIVNGLTDKTEQAIGTALPGAIRPRRPTSIPVIEQVCCDTGTQVPSGVRFRPPLIIRPLLITQSVVLRPIRSWAAVRAELIPGGCADTYRGGIGSGRIVRSVAPSRRVRDEATE